MTLTYKLDLDILPLYLHAEIQVNSVCLFGRECGNRHTDTHTDNVKTITPDTSQTWGVMKQIVGGLYIFSYGICALDFL